MPSFIVQFDCEEAILVENVTREKAEAMRDDLGCLPKAVLGNDNCEKIVILDCWTKNGALRVNYLIEGEKNAV